jgi:hypothetical protein
MVLLTTKICSRSEENISYRFPSIPVFSLLILVLATGLQTDQVDALSSKSPFESGYEHGCNDSSIPNFSDRYINQPEKGPSFHTDEFMRGYDTGYNNCS